MRFACCMLNAADGVAVAVAVAVAAAAIVTAAVRAPNESGQQCGT